MRSNRHKLAQTFPEGLLPPTSQWIKDVWCSRTFPNSLQTALEARFTLHHSGLRRFSEVEPHQTYLNLPCRPASPYIAVVRGGSVQLNLPELTPNYPSGPLPPSSQWFEGVRCCETAPNSLEPSCRPASPFVTVVRVCSVQSNLPQLTPNFPSNQLPPL